MWVLKMQGKQQLSPEVEVEGSGERKKEQCLQRHRSRRELGLFEGTASS